jgi:hypothetical protein
VRRSRFLSGTSYVLLELSPILPVVALAEDIPAGAVLFTLNSQPLSRSEIAIAACTSVAAPDESLFSFKFPEFPWRQVATSIATPNSPLLPPLPLMDAISKGRRSEHQEDREAAGHCREHSGFHVFVSLF